MGWPVLLKLTVVVAEPAALTSGFVEVNEMLAGMTLPLLTFFWALRSCVICGPEMTGTGRRGPVLFCAHAIPAVIVNTLAIASNVLLRIPISMVVITSHYVALIV